MTTGEKLTQRQIKNRLRKLSNENPGREAIAVYHEDGTVTCKLADAADYIVTGGGSVYIVTPTNDAAKANLEEGVSEEAQWFGNGVAVEHRYIQDLVSRLQQEGWTVQRG